MLEGTFSLIITVVSLFFDEAKYFFQKGIQKSLTFKNYEI